MISYENSIVGYIPHSIDHYPLFVEIATINCHCFASLKMSLDIKVIINTETANKNQDESECLKLIRFYGSSPCISLNLFNFELLPDLRIGIHQFVFLF